MSRGQPRGRQQVIACLVLIVCPVSSPGERSPVFGSESRSDSSEKRLALASAEPWRSRVVSSILTLGTSERSSLLAVIRRALAGGDSLPVLTPSGARLSAVQQTGRDRRGGLGGNSLLAKFLLTPR